MLRKLVQSDDEGFTLIELLVVVLIIAILLAIAIPTFLGTRGRAQNRAAESELRNALTTEKTVYTDTQAYTSTVATLSAAEPSLTWVTPAVVGSAASANTVNVATSDAGNEVCISTKSSTTKEYAIIDVAATDTSFATAGTFYYSNTGNVLPNCTGAVADETVQPANSSIGATTTAGGW